MLDQPQVPVAQRTNPERSVKEEVWALRLGDAEVLRGESILAVTKAILQLDELGAALADPDGGALDRTLAAIAA